MTARGLLRLLCAVAALLALPPRDVAAQSLPFGRLDDLPPAATEFVSFRHLLRSLAKVQHLLLTGWLENPRAAGATSALSYHLAAADRHRGYLEPGERPSLPAAPDLIHDGIRIVDLDSFSRRVDRSYRRMVAEECPKVRPSPPAKSEVVERHNFLVFYLTAVQSACGPPHEWRPSGIDRHNRELFAIFVANGARHGPAVWPALHRYLSDPANDTFPIRANIFASLYFQYLELAIDARFVSFSLNEFVVPSYALKTDLPELAALQDQLNYGLDHGLFK